MVYRLRDRIASAVVLALALAGFIHILELPAGAALFPKLVLGLTSLLSAIWLVSSLMNRRFDADLESEDASPFVENPVNLVIFIVAIGAYIALIDIIGYFTSTILFMAVLTVALGFRRFVFTGVAIVLFVGLVYCVFILLFERPLPIEFFQQ